MKIENQHTEWKESWRTEYLQWICAFANSKGGKLIIGKDDNGNTVGVAKEKKRRYSQSDYTKKPVSKIPPY